MVEDYVLTNIGEIPLNDYREMVAIQNGFESYDEMCRNGYVIDI